MKGVLVNQAEGKHELAVFSDLIDWGYILFLLQLPFFSPKVTPAQSPWSFSGSLSLNIKRSSLGAWEEPGLGA